MKFEAEGGIDKIEELQKHPNASVYDAIEVLITKYFGEDDQGVQDSGMAISQQQPHGNMFNIWRALKIKMR